MKTMISRIAAALLIALLATGLLVFALAESDANEPAPETGIATVATQETEAAESADSTGSKAIAAAIAIGAAGAAGKIRTSLMLGLVFIETAIIYALIVAILIIFVL